MKRRSFLQLLGLSPALAVAKVPEVVPEPDFFLEDEELYASAYCRSMDYGLCTMTCIVEPNPPFLSKKFVG